MFPTLIFSILFALMVLFTEHPPVTAGWPADTAVFAASMFLAGVYEEACLRACACDALLPALKKTRHPFFRTALISGLLFGYVHVVSADFSDLQQTLQFFLKMTNLALSGAAFMILYWKTRNLLGLAIVYGLNDFLPDVLNHIFQYQNMDTSAGYTGGDAGTTVIYFVQLVFEAVVLIHIFRKHGRTIDYAKTLEEW